MKKKLTALLLAATMGMTALAGCGKATDASNPVGGVIREPQRT